MTNTNSKKIRSKTSNTWSAQDLCDELQKLSEQPQWNKSTAERFIDLIVNQEQQYQLQDKQKENLIKTLQNCPNNYQAFVHLGIVIENFISSKGIRILDDIIPEIIKFIKKEKLKLEFEGKTELQKLEGDNLINWLEKKLTSKKGTEKIDFMRNFLSYVIGTKKTSKLSHRELAIAGLLSIKKSSIGEAQRLIRFESYHQILINQQTNEISQLNMNLQKEQEIRSQRESKIIELESHCQELKRQLLEAKTELEEAQANLEHEKVLYSQLQSTSETRISQQRKSVLSQVQNRLNHELDKLEPFFNSNFDSFQSNKQIGLKIISKIREQLSKTDNT